MSPNDTLLKIRSTEKRIEMALQEMEIATGYSVRDLRLQLFEVTRIESPCAEFVCSVRIEVSPPPAKKWGAL